MTNYFYQYGVTWWYDDEDKEILDEGIVCATSYANAVKEIEFQYDAILRIEYVEDIGDHLSKNVIDALKWRQDEDLTEPKDCDSCDQCKL